MKKFFWFSFLLFLMIPTAFAIPTIQQWKTTNGTRVYFVPALELPMVDVEVTFAAGSARDGEKHGLATLTNGLLSEGANGLSADQIAEQFENLGAKFSNSVDRDMASVSLRSLSEEQLLQPALHLMALVLAKPDFAATDFERIRQQMLASLEQQEQSPDDVARKAFYQAVFGEHPYAYLSDGTVEDITALTREDAQAFYQRYYVANNTIIAIVGALTRPQAEQLAQTLVSSLPTGEPAPALPSVKELTEDKTIHIDFPSTQTHILMGQPGMARLDPDYFTLFVGNHILGGSGLVSFLTKEIREQRGLAYSVYSYFSPLQTKGAFIAGLQTRNSQRAEALEITYKTLKQFIENGPTAEQLDLSKKNITGGFPLRIDSNSDIVGYLSAIGFYQLPLDYLQVFNSKIMAITREMIQETFQRRLHLDKWVTVTVGQKTD